MGDAYAAEYKSSLADLNCNSKPAITCMTMLAEENIQYAPQIVKVIIDHIHSVSPETKLPVLYLIDSIIKNIGKQYFQLFSQSIASIFTSVFEKVDENTRALMYKLRQTWNGIFPNKILYSIDTRVKQVDPAWPITAQPPTPSIHVNPKFLTPNKVEKPSNKPFSNQVEESEKLKAAQNEVLKTLFEKQKTLRELEERKRELAAKQFLSSQLPHGTSDSSVELRVGDPRIHTKLNPNLNQRDPRVKKALSAMLNKKTLPIICKHVTSDSSQKSVKETKKIPSVIATSITNSSTNTVSSVISARPTVSIPSTLISSVVVQKQETKSSPSKNISGKMIKDDSAKSHKPSQVPSENRKESAKNSVKPSKHDSFMLSPSKVFSGKRKRRSDEKMIDADKSDNSSPSKKVHRDKGSKKKDSPKSKNVDRSENSKDSKKHFRSRSRSPIPKFVKNSERVGVAADPRMRKKENLEIKQRDNEPKKEDAQKLNVPNDTRKTSPVPDTDDSKENIEALQKETPDSSEKHDGDDGIFARQDQDYRTMSKGLKNGPQKGWAMYKAAHPDQFRMPHPTAGNEKRSFDDFKKMPPRPGRPFFDNGRTEYDRLGRPKISRARIMQSTYISRFPPRDFDNRLSGRNPLMDRRLHDIFSGNPKDVLRQAEEQYQLGRISENQFRELQRDLERAWASEEYQHFKEMQQHSRNVPPFDEFNVPYNERERQMFHNRMDPGFTSNNGPHPVDSDNQYRINDRGMPVPPPDTSTFRLDNKNRVIHFIDDKAVILLDNGEPRELIFRGQPTQVEIEGLKPIMLRFDGKPVTFELNGKMYSLKFGAPSRELYVNNIPYKGEFAGPPFEVVLGGQIRRVRLCGPQPQVQVIDCPVSEDLYRRIMARTRGHNVQNAAMHLDIDMRGNPAAVDSAIKDTDLRLGGPDMDNLRDKPQFSGGNFRGPPVFNHLSNAGPLPMMGNQYRESMKDPGPWDHQNDPSKVPSIPEQVRHSDGGRAQNMPLQDSGYPCEPKPPTSVAPFNQHIPPPPWPVRDYSREVQGPSPAQVPESVKTFNAHRNSPQPLDSLPKEYTDAAQSRQSALHSGYITEPPRLELNQLGVQNRLPHPPLPPLPPWLNNPPPDQKALTALPPPPRPPLLMGMGMPPDLHSVPVSSGVLSIQYTSIPVSLAANTIAAPPLTAPPPFPLQSTAPPTVPPPAFDIGILFDKLLAAGIISKPSVPTGEKKETEDEENVKEKKKADEDEEDEEEEEQYIPPIEWKMDSLKGHYSGVISILYKGSECQSCGMRFRDPERYSRHLDWHFRMNRREKDGVKKAFSRKWYYEVEDWIQFEEFVDIDDRARSFFEMQADQQFEMEESAEQPSVPTMGREAEACVVCGETFKLFWVEEEEEWHLKNAVRQDEQVYHPSCYEDFKKASEKAATEAAEAKETVIKEEPLSPAEETVIQHDKDFNVDADLASIKIEIDESVTDLMHSLVTLVVETDNEPLPEVDEEVIEKVDEMDQEEEEEVLQGKPGEEEIIGVISESEEMDIHINQPLDDSEKVVIESGGIVMKFRAESLKPASPATDVSAEKDTVPKDSGSLEKKEQEDEVDEFRPPTPDPRFKQLPPVQRGLELSGMCCIM